MAADFIKDLMVANLAAGAAILFMLLVRKPVRRAFGARIAYAAWLIVPLTAAATFLPARKILQIRFMRDEVLPAPAESQIQFLIDNSPSVRVAMDPSTALIWIWVIGALVALSVLAVRQFGALKLLGPMKREAADVVRTSAASVGPAVLGFLKPRIMLPADFESRFSEREQALVLAHERAHLASWDVRINTVLAIGQCLFWFNPLVHLAMGPVREDQELACDESVVRAHPGERRAYAEALLKTQSPSDPLPLGCYWPSRSPQRLKERLVMLTRDTGAGWRRPAGWALVTTLAVGGGLSAWAATPETVVQIRKAPLVEAPAAAAEFRQAVNEVEAAPLAPAPAVQESEAAPRTPGVEVRRYRVETYGDPADGEGDKHVRILIDGEDETSAAFGGEVEHVIIRRIDAGDAQEIVVEGAEDGSGVRRRIEIAVAGDGGTQPIRTLGGRGEPLVIQCASDAGEDPVCTINGEPAEDAAQILEDIGGGRYLYRIEEE